MTYHRNKNRRFKSLISVWTSFAFVIFFFYIIGDLLIGWWRGAWWVWLIIGISGISAISTTLRYIAYRAGTKRSGNYYPQNNYGANSQIDENENYPVSSGSVRIIESQTKKEEFCKYCGQAITGPASYCPNCGAMVE